MSTSTLRAVPASDRSDSGALGLVLIAACAIAIGLAAYAFLRPHPAAFLPAGWHRPLSHDLSAAALGALPTFVHALAMPLLMAALLDARRGAQATICTGWCAVEILFEGAQHPAVGLPLLGALPPVFTGTGAGHAFANFVRNGTFDPIDIGAAVIASAIACATLARSSGDRSSMEARHA